MSEKQKPKPANDDATSDDEPTGVQNDLPPKSYYYDDATGYEIYREDDDNDDDEENNDP